MADLVWIEREGVLIARLVVPEPLSQKDLEEVSHQLMELPERSGGKILLDFRKVNFIYSLLLARLITLQKKCKASEIDLKLCNLNPLVMDVIQITRLVKFFDIYSSEQEAMAAF